jgi:hypothetical protein
VHAVKAKRMSAPDETERDGTCQHGRVPPFRRARRAHVPAAARAGAASSLRAERRFDLVILQRDVHGLPGRPRRPDGARRPPTSISRGSWPAAQPHRRRTSATNPTCGDLAENQRPDTPEAVAFLARPSP